MTLPSGIVGIAKSVRSTIGGPMNHRRFARPLQIVGAAGCAVLVVTLPIGSVVAGVAVFAVGIGYRAARRRKQDLRNQVRP